MDYEHLFEIELNAAGLAALNNERQNNFWAVGGSIRYDMQVVPEPSTYAPLCAGWQALRSHTASGRKQPR